MRWRWRKGSDQLEPEVVPGPIFGLRAWALDPGSSLLTAPFWSDAWEPGGRPTRFSCSDRGHHAPARECGCGLYGIHPLHEPATRGLGEGVGASPSEVLGIVEAWGEVEVHGDGFRAELARPHALTLIGCGPRSMRERVVAVAARYRVPVLEIETLEGLLSHCRRHDLGLSRSTVSSLVEQAPALPPVREPLRDRLLDRARTALMMAAVAVLNPLALIAGFVLLGVVFHGGGDPAGPAGTAAPGANPRLEVVAEWLIGESGDVRYAATVRNTSETRSALGVTVSGQLLDGSGEALNDLDPPRTFDEPLHLAPGERGLVVDYVRRKGADRGWSEEVAELRTQAVARRRIAGPERAQVSAGELRIDRERCVVLADLIARRRLPAAEVGAVFRGRRGEVLGAARYEVGPLEPGRSEKALLVLGPEDCRRPAPSTELTATLSRRELVEAAG